jgi:hypothetical protein
MRACTTDRTLAACYSAGNVVSIDMTESALQHPPEEMGSLRREYRLVHQLAVDWLPASSGVNVMT